MSDDEFHTLAYTLDQAWRRLTDGVADRTAPGRHPVLATAGIGGGAAARIVVLRGADRDAAQVQAHTDAMSGKVRELTADPAATLLIWDAAAQFQIRLSVIVTLAEGADVAEAWAQVPDAARVNYGATPPPGSLLSTPTEPVASPDPARFRVLDCAITRIETLHLGPDLHRRARFDRGDGWTGRWIAP